MCSSIVNRNISRIKHSPSMAAKAAVDRLRDQGQHVIDFTIGEPDLPTPSHIAKAGQDAIARGDTKYTSSSGTPALRKAIAQYIEASVGTRYELDQVVVGCGAKQVISGALAASLEAGDEVIVCAPYWVSYPDMVLMNGGVPVIITCDEASRFKLTPQALEDAITRKTRWVILNSPNNPTGAVYSPEELETLCDVLLRHPQVWLMSDEIYAPYCYDGAVSTSPLAVCPHLAKRTLLINGMSKAYAMIGWRVGYGAGPAPLLRAINAVISQSTSCPSAISQAAAIAALTGPQECVSSMVATFEMRRNRMVDLLAAIPHIVCTSPAGAFYVYPNIGGLIGKKTPDEFIIRSDMDVAMFLLERAGVAVLDGSSYGLSPYLRFSFAASMENIEEGCRRIREAVAMLE